MLARTQNKLKRITRQTARSLINQKHESFCSSLVERCPLDSPKTCSEGHLSLDLHSISGDKQRRCKSNTRVQPGRQTNHRCLGLSAAGWRNSLPTWFPPRLPPGQQNLLLSPGPAAFCPAENSITIGLCVHSVGGIFPLHCEVHSSAELGPWGF